jgi:imidazole glycerol-phosphate synthase subunit HisH
MIGIIEYGMGNLRSVQKAFEHLGVQARIMSQPDQATTQGITKLVLPGVGSFADGMEHLKARGWDTYIKDFVATGKPFLGICLGMQLIFTGSEEGAADNAHPVPGLAILPGNVVQFTRKPGDDYKIPHMGWNTLAWDRPDPLMAGLKQDCSVYFVHSYFVRSDEQTQAVATTRCQYPAGRPFVSSVWKDNVWATQFHPEKSQLIGLTMLKNFAAI